MKLHHISKTYHNKHNDVKALNDINLYFANNGMTFIVGESGCGKTTLLNIICKKDNYFTGNIEYDGKVECIEQEIMLMENLSIEDNLLLVCDDKKRIDELLNRFHLFNKKQKVKLLSGGEKKRVQILRSLLTDASYLVCDEPTASLDYDNSLLVMEMLKELSSETGIIIVTHDLALKDSYSTRTIRMGKGIILEDEIAEHNSVYKESKDITKSFLDKLSLTIKLILSRKRENLLKLFIFFILTLSLFCATFLFTSFNKGLNAKNSWYNANNVILSYPLNIENNVSQIYDIYTRDNLELVKYNTDGIIAYRCGWDEIYSTAGNNSFVREMNIDGLRKYVDKYINEYKSTGIEPVPFFKHAYDTLTDIDERYPDDSFDKSRMIATDYSSYKGFNWRDEDIDVPSNSNVTELGYEYYIDVVPYQLIYDIDIKYGNICKEDNEIVVNLNTAEELCKVLDIDHINDLIGRKINLKIAYDYKSEVIVSGISFYENKYENIIFFKDGAYDYLLADCFNMVTDDLTYQYLGFICDPYTDNEDIIYQINYLLESKDSEFILYNEINYNYEYQDPITFYIFIICILIFSIIIYVIMEILLNRRIVKEMMILNRYGYSSIIMNYISMSLLLIGVSIIQMIFLPYICNMINVFINTLNLPDIVNYSITHYLFAYILSVLLIFIISGVINYVRVKKYSKKI